MVDIRGWQGEGNGEILVKRHKLPVMRLMHSGESNGQHGDFS